MVDMSAVKRKDDPVAIDAAYKTWESTAHKERLRFAYDTFRRVKYGNHKAMLSPAEERNPWHGQGYAIASALLDHAEATKQSKLIIERLKKANTWARNLQALDKLIRGDIKKTAQKKEQKAVERAERAERRAARREGTGYREDPEKMALIKQLVDDAQKEVRREQEKEARERIEAEQDKAAKEKAEEEAKAAREAAVATAAEDQQGLAVAALAMIEEREAEGGETSFWVD